MTTKSAYTVVLICIGQRIIDRDKGRLAMAFVERARPKAPEIYFTKVKHTTIGERYEAEKVADGHKMSSRPEKVKTAQAPKVAEILLEEWAEKDLAAGELARQIRHSRIAENKAKILARECPAIGRALAGLSFTARRAFVDHLIDEVDTIAKGKKR